MKDSEIKYLYACGDENRKIAKFFEYKNEHKNRYLKKIKVYADCKKEEAEFKINICDLDDNNEPGPTVHEERFVAKEGSHWIEKDIINAKIVIPKNGLFLVLWLINHWKKKKFVPYFQFESITLDSFLIYKYFLYYLF